MNNTLDALAKGAKEHARRESLAQYGSDAEKLSQAQLELLNCEPGVAHMEVRAEGDRDPLPYLVSASWKSASQELPPSLERIERLVVCTPEQVTCRVCGAKSSLIGYEESERLEWEPTKYFVAVTKQEVRSCCNEQGLIWASLPPPIINQSLAGDQLVIEMLVSKYWDDTPLYRQGAILDRASGSEHSEGMLRECVLEVGNSLIPLAAAMRRELISGAYIQGDGTLLMDRFFHRGSLWRYCQLRGTVVFDFCLARDHRGPEHFLRSFEGVFQTDQHIALDKIKRRKIIHAGCWLRVEQYFAEAMEASPTIATPIVARIGDLFAIEAQARSHGLSLERRQTLRHQQSRPLLEIIRGQIESAQSSAPSEGALDKACNSTLKGWEGLVRFLEYPELELHSELSDKSIRPIGVGCKRWIHLGVWEQEANIVPILSVMETCRRLDLPVREYLSDILPGIGSRRVQRIAELTPLAWSLNHASALHRGEE